MRRNARVHHAKRHAAAVKRIVKRGYGRKQSAVFNMKITLGGKIVATLVIASIVVWFITRIACGIVLKICVSACWIADISAQSKHFALRRNVFDFLHSFKPDRVFEIAFDCHRTYERIKSAHVEIALYVSQMQGVAHSHKRVGMLVCTQSCDNSARNFRLLGQAAYDFLVYLVHINLWAYRWSRAYAFFVGRWA